MDLYKPIIPEPIKYEYKPLKFDIPEVKPLKFDLPEFKPLKLDYLESKPPKFDFLERERQRRDDMLRDSAVLLSPRMVKESVTGREIGIYNPCFNEIKPNLGGPSLKVDVFGGVSTVMGRPVGHMERCGPTMELRQPVYLPPSPKYNP